MKRKLFVVIVVVTTMAISGFNVCQSQQMDKLVDLTLANIEALAGGESDCHYTNGYTAFGSSKGGAYDCCQVWVPKAPKTDEGHCR